MRVATTNLNSIIIFTLLRATFLEDVTFVEPFCQSPLWTPQYCVPEFTVLEGSMSAVAPGKVLSKEEALRRFMARKVREKAAMARKRRLRADAAAAAAEAEKKKAQQEEAAFGLFLSSLSFQKKAQEEEEAAAAAAAAAAAELKAVERNGREACAIGHAAASKDQIGPAPGTASRVVGAQYQPGFEVLNGVSVHAYYGHGMQSGQWQCTWYCI